MKSSIIPILLISIKIAQVYSEETTLLLKTKCTNNATCSLRNSFCHYSLDPVQRNCHCNQDYFADPYGVVCFPSSNASLPEYLPPSCENNGSCLAGTTPIGSRCSIDADCVGQPGKSECHPFAFFCTCLDGLITADDLMDCLEIRNQLGDQCVQDNQCQQGVPGQLSECTPSGCACTYQGINPPNQHNCLRRANLVGEPCVHNVQCEANLGDLSECFGTTCRCEPSRAIPSISNRECLEIINTIGGECVEDQQCQEGEPGQLSQCVWSGLVKICECTDDAVHADGKHKCHLKADLVGDACQEHIQCTTNLGEFSECSSTQNECVCIPGIGIPHSTNLKCLEIINKLGEECEESQQCTEGVPGPWGVCALDPSSGEKVCSCTDEALVEPGFDICFQKAVEVGDDCTVQSQCRFNLGDLSECGPLGTCDCSDGAVPSTDQKRCLYGPIAIGGPCVDNSQCVGFPTGSMCTPGGTCACRQGYIPSADLLQCLPISLIGDPCEERQQCQQGLPGEFSDCFPSVDDPNVKICNCTEDAVASAIGEKCYKKAEFVGDPCEVQEQCVANLVRSQCLSGTCRCFDDSTPSTGNDKCLLKKYLGEDCEDQTQCSHISYSASCVPVDPVLPVDLKCECDPGFLNPSGVIDICYRLAEEIGETCGEHEIQCIELDDSECVAGTCECDLSTHVVSETKKKCLIQQPDLEGQCEETAQCMVGNSICVENQLDELVCQCEPGGFIESEINPGTCVEIIKEVNVPCGEDLQCSAGLGDNSDCTDEGVCECLPNYAFYDGFCHLAVELGEDCESDEECHAGADDLTYCHPDEKTCQCRPDTIEHEGVCYNPATHVGDPCQIDLQCTHNLGDLSECSIIGFCLCLSNSTGNSDNTKCIPGQYYIGEPCQDNTQCVAQPDRSECGRSVEYGYCKTRQCLSCKHALTSSRVSPRQIKVVVIQLSWRAHLREIMSCRYFAS